MIFVINETNQKLKLNTTEVDGTTVMSVMVKDAQLPIVTTEDPDISKAMQERFAEPEKINHKLSKYNFWVDGKMLLITRQYDAEGVDPIGCKLISHNRGEELPERYTTSKDAIVIVHPHDTSVYMDSENLTNEDKFCVTSERNEFDVTILPIKWYNWSMIHPAVIIYVNDEPAYQLSSKDHKEIEGRKLNAVRSLRKEKSE